MRKSLAFLLLSIAALSSISLGAVSIVFGPKLESELRKLDNSNAGQVFFNLIAHKLISYEPTNPVSDEFNYLRWTILALSNKNIVSENSEQLALFSEFCVGLNRILPSDSRNTNSNLKKYTVIDDILPYEYLDAIENLQIIEEKASETAKSLSFLSEHIMWYMLFLDQEASKYYAENFNVIVENKYLETAFNRFIRSIALSPGLRQVDGRKIIDDLIFIKKLNQNNSQSQVKQLLPIDEIKIIFNNDGFESENQKHTENHKKGKSIDVTGIKTGYNIFFPNTFDVNSAIIVKVYGGNEKKEKQRDYTIAGLTAFDEYLLRSNHVVVSLNLPDRLSLKLSQNFMSEELHASIHQAINNFYEIVSNRPETLIDNSGHVDVQLEENVKNLKGRKMFIMGQSFGGRTAVKQLQLYPGTFTGAMSIAGNFKYPCDHLSVVDNFEVFKDRIFLAHCIQDIASPLSSSCLTFRKLCEKEKSAQLFLYAKSSNEYLRLGFSGIIYHGHGFPSCEQEFNRLCDAVSNFIHETDINETGEYFDKLSEIISINHTLEPKSRKNKDNNIWYFMKENLFFHVPKEQRAKAKSMIIDIANKTKTIRIYNCMIQ
ncbi:MAG: hypothetical protein KC505_10920 [Myxococcales bacterium]|nr:hypothetical protein [Myxococcales bacterium]